MRLFVAIAALFGVVFFLVPAPAAAAAELTLPNQSATAGTSLLVPLAFASQSGSVSGIQFDLTFEPSAMSVGAILGIRATDADKGLYVTNLTPNTKRFLIIGMNSTPIASGTLLNLFVDVSPIAASDVYALTLSNVAGTDPSGNVAAITSTDGALTVTSTSGLHAAGVRSAASFMDGPVAPGEIITLVGSAIGPSPAQLPSGAASGTNLGGTSVLFDGTAAPLLYAGPNQINAVVPYGVSGKTATQMQVMSEGNSVAMLSVPVAAAAPAIFTIDSSGVGPGAILNQDSTVNSESNPAATGSVISIYATGAGQTAPSGVDGQVTGSTLSHPLLAVSVQIGGMRSKVLYAGAAPGLISGALQVNAEVPSGVAAGPSVPVLVTIGTANSQSGVTVAIR